MTSAWLRPDNNASDAPFQLVCFPYAGSLSPPFADWGPALAPAVELLSVRLPGRGARWSEPPPASVPAVAEALLDPLLEQLRGPFAFFGHSMGALLAFELAHRVSELGAVPSRLFASSYRAPHLPGTREQFHLAPDDRLMEHLDTLSDGELSGHRDVLAPVLAVLRNDLRLCETYRPAERKALAAPVTALRGRRDPLFTAAEVRRWSETTTGPFRFLQFPGGHFYPRQREGELLEHLRAECVPEQ